MPDTARITMDQLKVGLYIYLDLKWFDQPFAFGNFKIKNEEQIRVIRTLGLDTVRYNPALSSTRPDPPAASTPPATGEVAQMVSDAPAAVIGQSPSEMSPALAAKRAMVERIKQQREATARVEQAFVNTANAIRDIDKNLYAKPVETVQQATALVNQIAESILSEPELAIHVMGDKLGGEELYFHSLNVTILAMMMARDMKLPPELVGALGMGAMFHDIGNKEIPERLLTKMDALTTPERHLLEMHTQYGLDISQRLKLAPNVQAIIREHHEHADGSGYPGKLKGEAIGILARIVIIANHYDELCNPLNIDDALTPHEVLSLMFAKLRSKFDGKILQLFIRCLGVYPPGTIVQLSNGVIGMVATVNTERPMKPMLMIYDEHVPKAEAIMVDMEFELDVNIAKAVRPAQVPRDIYNYLSPRKRVSYYFDATKPSSGAKPK